jgi:predicted transcriptional regulator of viral defense system
MTTHLENLLRVAEAKGLIRARDLGDHGIPRQYLSIACERGLLERLDRGLYALPGGIQSEHRSLVEVCKLVPHGVICLLSAEHSAMMLVRRSAIQALQASVKLNVIQ